MYISALRPYAWKRLEEIEKADILVGIPLIPNWSRVISALPDLFDLLLEVVEKDNA